ncbi:MAG: LuxR C-terminal-related transcriptional regulator [Xenococcaceae cyanobacterium]
MANSVHSLIQAIATAKDERELRLRFMDTVGEYFGVQRWGIYLLDEQSRLAQADVQGIPDSFIDLYEEVGRAIDPVMRYVIEHHAPAHEQTVLPPGGWKQCELYRLCCSRHNHKHIMTGPILGNGHIIGTVHFARTIEPAFDDKNLAELSAICTHLSVRLAILRAQPNQFNFTLASRLTERELQIAELVAQGLTNTEIGAELWITYNSVKQALKRMFRKLEVSKRAEMVAKLQGVLGSSTNH